MLGTQNYFASSQLFMPSYFMALKLSAYSVMYVVVLYYGETSQ